MLNETQRKRFRVLAVAFFLLGSCGALQSAVDEPLKWTTVSNDAALCNDFTKAGFFHRKPANDAKKWVVFLESGAVCYSSETCNRRYFNSTIQDRESKDRHANSGYGDFDTELVYRKYAGTNFVNPLMTSMECFSNTSFFPNGLEIQGRDLFDRRLTHSFADHGHVVIPYCSSDVWLGAEDGTRHSERVTDAPCSCSDQECFKYDPNARDLQFTFRGKVIFQSVLRDLVAMYSQPRELVRELVLVGSSAGGVGVLNLAGWVVSEFPWATVKVIADSAWFVNFRNGIYRQFSDLQKPQEDSGDQPSTPAVIGSSSHVTAPSSHMISSSPTMGPSSSVNIAISTVEPSLNIGTPSPSTTAHSANSATPSSNTGTPSPSTTAHSANSATPSSNIGTPSHPTETPSPNIGTPSPTDGSGSASGIFEEEDEEMMKRYAPIEFEANQYAEQRDRRYMVSPDDRDDLILLLKSHDACSDIRRGYPCCLSAHCLLSSTDPITDQPYFPENVSLFVLTSLYDVFILSQAINGVRVYREDTQDTDVGLAIEYLTLVGEYGGVMDYSLMEVQDSGNVNLTFYVSQCFQHVYLATSTLWGERQLLGNDQVQINQEIGAFR